MIALILIYFIGKNYANVAELYKKNKIGWAILGIAIYLVCNYVLQIIIGFTIGLTIQGISETQLKVLSLAIALGCMAIGYFTSRGILNLLEKNWKAGKGVYKDEELLDEF